jgi:hypothetical protein
VSAIARVGEGRRAIAELRVDVHAVIEEFLHGRRVALARRFCQRVGLV